LAWIRKSSLSHKFSEQRTRYGMVVSPARCSWLTISRGSSRIQKIGVGMEYNKIYKKHTINRFTFSLLRLISTFSSSTTIWTIYFLISWSEWVFLNFSSFSFLLLLIHSCISPRLARSFPSFTFLFSYLVKNLSFLATTPAPRYRTF